MDDLTPRQKARKNYYNKNKEKYKVWYDKFRDIIYNNGTGKNFEYRLKRKYNITVYQYAIMRHVDQKNCCPICSTQFEDSKKPGCIKSQAVVDHDHITGKIRGILCNECNKALGCFKDNLFVLKRALNYLGE